MGHESSIRLPTRLVGVVRTDPATPAGPNAPPVSGPAPKNTPTTPSAADTLANINLELETERAQIQRVLFELTRGVQELRNVATQTMADVKTAAVDLALAVATHFLMEQVHAGAFPFERLVESALERLMPRQPVTVSLHPDDLALLHARLGESPALANTIELRWTTGPTLRRGDVRVETPDRSALFDMQERLEQLRQLLHQVAADDE